MRYKLFSFMIVLCLISTSASANSQGNSDGKPAAVICVGVTDRKSEGQFELVCHIQEQEWHDTRSDGDDKDQVPIATLDKTYNSEVLGCDEPGDVIEQGFCLD
ncbi:hypothetical protein [Tateyamaria sp. SN3-11]|uniref:hypothetical protein n=1 Tax=Tateyamaria sp. SN3-11 TaxID=3092147 RepID=UPI0039E7F9C2